MKKVAVVGGGITGAYAGYFLARSGIDTTIIDPDNMENRASNINPGGINPLHGPGIPGAMSTFAMESYRLHRSEWQQISELSALQFDGRIISRIFVALTEEDESLLKESGKLYEDADSFTAQWYDSTQLQQYDPRINRAALGGLLTTGNGTVNAPLYRRAVLSAAYNSGAKWLVAEVSGIVQKGDRITALRVGKDKLEFDDVVFATGPWVDFISTNLGVRVPIRPVKGEMLVVKMQSGSLTHDITWRHNGIYHEKEDIYWLGGTLDESGLDCSPTDVGRDTVIENVSRIIPDLTECSIVSHVAGLRPMSIDGLPIIGNLPGWSNAFIVGGAGSKGMLLSALLGKTISRIVQEVEPGVELSIISMDRF
jgi:glycine oxidase